MVKHVKCNIDTDNCGKTVTTGSTDNQFMVKTKSTLSTYTGSMIVYNFLFVNAIYIYAVKHTCPAVSQSWRRTGWLSTVTTTENIKYWYFCIIAS